MGKLVIVESPTKVPILPKFYCYILKSLKSGKYYIGCANSYLQRLNQHNAGLVQSTKSDKPWQVVHCERLASLKEARRREQQIKKWKSRKAIETLFKI